MVESQWKGGPFARLVVFGDSIVEGGQFLARTEERWADILKNLIEAAQERPLEYHNAGLSASVIAPSCPQYDASAKPSGTERFEPEALDRSPDLLVIAYGLNSMRAGMSPGAFAAEMEKLILQAKQKLSATIVLVGVYHMVGYSFYPPFDKGGPDAGASFNAALRELADKHDCIFADVSGAMAGADHLVHEDTVHPNKVGHLIVAHKVFQSIATRCEGIAEEVHRRDAVSDWTKETRAIRSQLQQY